MNLGTQMSSNKSVFMQLQVNGKNKVERDKFPVALTGWITAESCIVYDDFSVRETSVDVFVFHFRFVSLVFES